MLSWAINRDAPVAEDLDRAQLNARDWLTSETAARLDLRRAARLAAIER